MSPQPRTFPRLNVTLSPVAARKLAELVAVMGASQSEIVRRALELFHRAELRRIKGESR